MVVTSSNRNSHLWLGCVYILYNYVDLKADLLCGIYDNSANTSAN